MREFTGRRDEQTIYCPLLVTAVKVITGMLTDICEKHGSIIQNAFIKTTIDRALIFNLPHP